MRGPVLLVGMMGSGKTSVGRELARLLREPWADLDRELERRFRRSVSRQFAVDGEKAFRKRESALLKRLCRGPQGVLSTGGGVVESSENRRLLRRSLTVYLSASPRVLAGRLKREAAKRPLLSGPGESLEARLRRLSRRRTPLYRACARLTVRASAGNAEAVARRVLKRLRALG